MKIAYLHASKFGNGAAVAEEFQRQAGAASATVTIHHIREVDPRRPPTAELYVFSSPGRLGRPIGSVRRFLRRLRIPAGTRYALLTTEMAPPRGDAVGPDADEPSPYQRVRPIMDELLQAAGLVKVADDAIHVMGTKGPLEDGWTTRVKHFVEDVLGPDAGPTGRSSAGAGST